MNGLGVQLFGIQILIGPREAYLSLLTDIRDPNFNLSDLRARRDDLQS